MLPHLPKAIMLDMDDTILADALMSDRCWQEVCDRFASRIGYESGDALLETIRDIRQSNLSNRERLDRGGADLRSVRQALLSSAFATLGIGDSELVQEMTDSYMALKLVNVEPFPGALDALRKLKQDGFRLALITNGLADEQWAKIRLAELEPLFESILIEGEFGVGKPDPRVFLHTLDRLKVQSEDTWMVGDNLVNDVGGAQAVGIGGVWVDWQGRGLPERSAVKPDHIIQAITDLVN